MTPGNVVSKLIGLSIGCVAFLFGTIAVGFLNSDVNPYGENPYPGRHAGEWFEIVETDDTFPWERQQIEARDFYREFQTAVAADNRKKVATMMMYPLRVHYFSDAKAQEYRFLQSQAELLKVYDKVFHSSVKAYIANTKPEEIWGNDYFLQTGYGQIGIYVKTNGDCPACSFDMKVKIIASNTIYRESVEDIFGNPLNAGNNP